MQSVNLTLWNAIPKDITAAKVVFVNGVRYEVEIPKSVRHYDVCPPIRPFNKALINDPNHVDYTGVRFGRFTVIGMAEDYAKRMIRRADNNTGKIVHKVRERGACMWVVRCDCGQFELRRTSVIKAASIKERCFVCMSVFKSKRKHFFKNHKRSPTLEEMKLL